MGTHGKWTTFASGSSSHRLRHFHWAAARFNLTVMRFPEILAGVTPIKWPPIRWYNTLEKRMQLLLLIAARVCSTIEPEKPSTSKAIDLVFRFQIQNCGRWRCIFLKQVPVAQLLLICQNWGIHFHLQKSPGYYISFMLCFYHMNWGQKNMTNPNNALITGKKTSKLPNKPCNKLWIPPKNRSHLDHPLMKHGGSPVHFWRRICRVLPSSPGHRSFLPAPTQLAKRSCRTQVAASRVIWRVSYDLTYKYVM